MGDSVEIKLILFENQIQTTSTSPCRTQVQPAASFLVCSLIFIEYYINFILEITARLIIAIFFHKILTEFQEIIIHNSLTDLLHQVK